MPKKLTTATFIQRSALLHGGKFSYEHTTYVNSKTPVTITCTIHGDISVDPNNHIHKRSGCPLCYGNVRKTTEQFISDVKQKHGDIFCFDRTQYNGDGAKVTITCLRHGDFTPTASNVLQGSGCPKCALEQASVRNRKTTAVFIAQASKAHDNKYDYSLVEYKNSATHVVIVCPTHGAFSQTPSIHLDQRCGCPKCSMSIGEQAYATIPTRTQH